MLEGGGGSGQGSGRILISLLSLDEEGTKRDEVLGETTEEQSHEGL